MTKRDNFSRKTINILSRRAGFLCSNPTCRKETVGSNEDKSKFTLLGVAAHITAASYGGPRYNKNLNETERCGIDNGIWLCTNCATLIDKDKEKFSVELLNEWKQTIEKESAKVLGESSKKKLETAVSLTNFSETTLDIGYTNLGPNPYFTYEDNLMDFIATVYAVGNSIGYVKSKSLTLVRFSKEGVPTDSKEFKAEDLNGHDLIYSNKPFKFSQKMGNLTTHLLENLFVVLDVEYTNEAHTLKKYLHKIYSVKPELAGKNLPQATAEQYTIINEFLDSRK